MAPVLEPSIPSSVLLIAPRSLGSSPPGERSSPPRHHPSTFRSPSPVSFCHRVVPGDHWMTKVALCCFRGSLWSHRRTETMQRTPNRAAHRADMAFWAGNVPNPIWARIFPESGNERTQNLTNCPRRRSSDNSSRNQHDGWESERQAPRSTPAQLQELGLWLTSTHGNSRRATKSIVRENSSTAVEIGGWCSSDQSRGRHGPTSQGDIHMPRYAALIYGAEPTDRAEPRGVGEDHGRVHALRRGRRCRRRDRAEAKRCSRRRPRRRSRSAAARRVATSSPPTGRSPRPRKRSAASTCSTARTSTRRCSWAAQIPGAWLRPGRGAAGHRLQRRAELIDPTRRDHPDRGWPGPGHPHPSDR